MPEDREDIDPTAALMAFSLMAEAFMDMAVALGRYDRAAALAFVTRLEEQLVARLQGFEEFAGGGPGARGVVIDAALNLRDVTQEAKKRIRQAGTGS